MKTETRKVFIGERALYASRDLHLIECTFDDGESPLKESSNIVVDNSLFKWKYPLWYCNDVVVNSCTLFEMARAGMWYTHNITFNNCVIEAPKSFRKSTRITLNNVSIPNAAETLFNCSDVKLKDVYAQGTYFAMNCRNVTCDNLTLIGDYCFDGAENLTITNSKLLSKDSFWNCRNVTVRDSFISGEYLAWNSENVTLINCRVESLQGFCYVKNLKLVNCTLINTTRAFEYSTVDAEIVGHVDSIVNPTSGRIVAGSIGELVMDSKYIDPSKTTIITTDKKND